MDAQSCDGTEDCGPDSGTHSYNERVAQRLEKHPVLEQHLIPAQGKSGPDRTALGIGVIKRKNDKEENRRIEEYKNQRHIDPRNRFFHISMPPPCDSPSSNSFMIPMQMRMSTIRTREIAEPRFGL